MSDGAIPGRRTNCIWGSTLTKGNVMDSGTRLFIRNESIRDGLSEKEGGEKFKAEGPGADKSKYRVRPRAQGP